MTSLETAELNGSCSAGGPARDSLRALALEALGRMYRSDRGLFAFRLRGPSDRELLEGESRRYTAIALIGLSTQDEATGRGVLGGESACDVCRRLLDGVSDSENLGDVALVLWAALALHIDEAGRACDRMRVLQPCDGSHPTVELAWALTSLAVDAGFGETEERLRHDIAEMLLSSFVSASEMFSHWPTGANRGSWRSHVSCFADLVYPIQALAHHYMCTSDQRAIAIAQRCATRLCSLQGASGQWWWHYDVRTGQVIERYPVYAVHQDAMAPMALLALNEAGGGGFDSAIERGFRWLNDPPELAGSLIDHACGVIWRKVARREPGKVSRGVQALASRVHPRLRVPGLGAVLRPGRIDYECRPYHLGWLLYALSDRRPGS